jgi:hypothetical protein
VSDRAGAVLKILSEAKEAGLALRSARTALAAALAQGAARASDELAQDFRRICIQSETLLATVDSLADGTQLEPELFALLETTRRQLLLFRDSARVGEREAGGAAVDPIVALVVDAFPQAFTYRKPIPGSFLAHVVLPTRAGPASPRKKRRKGGERERERDGEEEGASAELPLELTTETAVSEEAAKRKAAVELSGGVAKLERDTSVPSMAHGRFDALQAETGSRKSLARLRCVLTWQGTTFHSEWSNPFVVMTHESQWCGAEGSLLRSLLFGDHLTSPTAEELAKLKGKRAAGFVSVAPWARFTNLLQAFVVRATRQDLSSVSRPLFREELASLETTVASRDPASSSLSITRAAFDSFWDWFGPAFARIHFKKHLATMWNDGLIAGVVSRAEAEKLLRDQEVGTFLVRLSDSNAGFLVVSYVAGASSVSHMLVKKQHTDERAFPDALHDWDTLSALLRIVAGSTDRRERSMAAAPKDEVLASLYSTTSSAEVPAAAARGYQYEPLLKRSAST